jgi:hypothetical protein
MVDVFPVPAPGVRLEIAGALSENEPASVAVPVRAAVWGELLSLSATLSTAERGPKATGVNVTEMEQFSVGIRVTGNAPQPFISAFISVNELAFVPVIEMPVTTKAAVPMLLSNIG